ncbi:MAG: S-layer homology domain-containing protein [Clostridia bacterium]|nr:S-layer homology domain-containing protein [Clostridia bacterium]
MKKILSIFLVAAMLLATCVAYAATYTDISGHWAQKEIEAWSEYGVISGYDGKFSPNRYITRGEFAVVLNRLMAYQEESLNVFHDLPDKFYTSSVLKLYKAGVMQGYAGSISPEASLTREEASVMICRALGIKTADTMNKTFSDVASVSTWSKPYINAMVNTGLLNGADGKLNPKNPIMRSEVVKILDNAVSPILKAGTFDKVSTNKILVISTGGVTVKNSEITGKVIITQGVLDGILSFVDSKIQSDVVIDNDRSAFVELKNTTVANKAILNDKAFITEKDEGNSSSGGNNTSSGGNTTGGNNSSSGGNSSGGDSGSTGGGDSSGDNSGDEDTGSNIDRSKLIETLISVSEEIALYTDRSKPNFYTVFNNTERAILSKIKVCIDDAVTNHENELDADFIKTTYYDEINEVHGIYDQMSASGQDDAFIGKLAANFAIYNLIWLADTLGVDLEAYGINPDDYIY